MNRIGENEREEKRKEEKRREKKRKEEKRSRILYKGDISNT